MGKKVKVEKVVEADPNNLATPILLRFEHAVVNPSSSSVDLNQVFGTAVFQNDPSHSASRDMSHLNRSAFENRSAVTQSVESKGSKRKHVVALQSDAMTYIGTKGLDNPHLASSTTDMMRTFVALKHKKKMRLFEVTPITISPFLKGHSHVLEKANQTKMEKSKEEKREAGIDLVKAFGSKKKRLTYERLEKNKIDVSDMQTSIDAAINKLEVPEKEPAIKDESIIDLIPPCDREAKLVVDVYRLQDLIGESELEEVSFTELARSLLDVSLAEIKNWKETKKYSDYFIAMWEKILPRKNDTNAIRKAKIVLYTEYLIIFLKLKHEQIRKKKIELPDIFPLWMKEKVLDSFTVVNANGSRNRPESCKDKACCYIMVLVLLANDFGFDVKLMSTSLNIHINKLLLLAKAVGITITYNPGTKEHRGILKCPLPKPIERRGRRRALR